MTANLIVDENNGEVWWDAARAATGPDDPAAAEVWATLVRHTDPGGRVTADAATIVIVLAYAATLPGWSDGPDHARHPLYAW